MTPRGFRILLAKSQPAHEGWKASAGLVGHTENVLKSAEVLTQHLGSTIWQQLALEEFELERFIAIVKLGAFLHDWGKANRHFQIMVRQKKPKDCANDQERKQQKDLQEEWKSLNERQMLRHEAISGILAMNVDAFWNWLQSQYSEKEITIAAWAAMGHHLKIGGKNGKKIDKMPKLAATGSPNLSIYTGHDHFNGLLKLGVKHLKLSEVLPSYPTRDWSTEELKASLKQLLECFIQFEKSITESEKRWIAAIKATVMTADLVGSAIPATGYSIEKWIEEKLKLVLTPAEIQELLDQRLGQNSLRPFQQQIAESRSRVTLVQAGCGTGKTIAAYAWAKHHAEGRRLFFGYPTTGTASQGFLDYAATTDIETALMHSRSQIDLEEILFSNEAEHDKQTEDNDTDAEKIDARLASFQAWEAKLIVCTVDSVLGLLQNNRKPLYSWATLCQSAFVFDEVHAYGEKLFGALLRFLKTFRGAPILLMSASFTEGQKAKIKQVVEEDLGETLNDQIPSPQNLENLPRYSIHRIDHPEIAWESAEATLQRKEKVLWVTNTVNSCIELYLQACKQLRDLDCQILIYHSRYRYHDRKAKHQAVIDAFNSDRAILAITTQVCEMSLDLSAQLLVSAMAPAPALIQRMGRLNRKVIESEGGTVSLKSGKICPALIYDWRQKAPYKKDGLETGEVFCYRLLNQELTQADLAIAAADLDLRQPLESEACWLDGRWRSYPGALREAGYTITVLLEDDLPKIWAQVRKPDKPFGVIAQGWTVPIPLNPYFTQWKRQGIYPIAPSSVVTYCRNLGARTHEPD
ncbi:CRISPR-associated helicase Cas3' [Cyanobacteria bacterium FACHB-63]|nr:CRISPR-associated helicase Cas3' [Cyanobacteria bacterium FACHB-63]